MEKTIHLYNTTREAFLKNERWVCHELIHVKQYVRYDWKKFGFGEVIKMEGAAHNPIATVKFEHNGEKKIMLNYAKLRIVD